MLTTVSSSIVVENPTDEDSERDLSAPRAMSPKRGEKIIGK